MKEFFEILGIIFLFIFTAGFLGRSAVMYFDSAPVSVMVNLEEVYDGPSYGVEVKTAGANTIVVVYGEGFFAWKVKAAYVGKNVIVSTVKGRVCP